MYLEASSGRYGDNARLASPNLQGQCTLRLFYHMFGQHVNSLNIYVRTTVDGQGTRVMNVSGQAGDNWLRLEVQLTAAGSKPFQVIIEGVSSELIIENLIFIFHEIY